MAERYYTEEITAVKFRVLKQCFSAMLPGPLASGMAAWFRLRGILRWPLAATYGIGDVDSKRVVPREGLPARAVSLWAPQLKQLANLGFAPLEYGISDTIGQKQQAIALFLDEPGSTIATLQWIRMEGAEGPVEKVPIEFNSYAPEDPDVLTGCVTEEELPLADMLRLPFVNVLVLPDTLPLSAIYRRHVERTAGRSCYRMEGDALQEHRSRQQRRFEWTLQQGLMRPLSAAEVDRVRQLRLE
jgi:hypothetical protein